MKELQQPVQLGVIGLGDHARRGHLDHLIEVPGLASIVAISDIRTNQMDQIADHYSLTAEKHSDWHDLIADERIEAVMIMTPDRLHITQLAGAVAAGKHVLCEKPLATNPAELRQLHEQFLTAQDQNLTVTTCHPRRFDPPFLWAKAYLQLPELVHQHFGIEADFGQPTNLMFQFDYPRPSKTGLHTSLMFDHLNHEVDLMHMLFGKSTIRNATKHLDSKTNFHVTGIRQDGITFDFRGLREKDESGYDEQMIIECERGELVMDMADGDARVFVNAGIAHRQSDQYKTNYRTRFEQLNRHFLNIILSQADPYVSPDELMINTGAAISLHTQSETKH